MFGVTGLHINQLKLKYDEENSRAFRLNFVHWIISWISGHVAGGMFFFGLVGLAGSFLTPALGSYSILILAIICVSGALHQFSIVTLPMPQLARQVSRFWLTELHRNIVALGYGFQLGSSVATRIKVMTTYAVIGCAFCSGSILSGIIIGAVFGFSRSLLPVVFASRTATPDKSFTFAVRFNSYEAEVRKINGVALLLAVICLAFVFYGLGLGNLLK